MTLRLSYRAFRRVGIASQLVPPGVPSTRYRPVIPIRAFDPRSSSSGIHVGDAFADPGSDMTILRRGFFSALGITAFVHQMSHRWKGVDYPVRFAPARLELSDGTAKCNWPATVGFSDAPIPYGCLLGLSGFFEFFDVRFMGYQRVLEIEPNELFRIVGGITGS